MTTAILFLIWFIGVPVLTLAILWLWHRFVRNEHDPLYMSEETVDRLSDDLNQSDRGWREANP